MTSYDTTAERVPDCIEPGQSADDAALVVVMCKACFEDGSFDSMYPSEPGPHDRDRTWGVAEIERDDQGEMHVTWHHVGLARAEAEALI